MAKTPVTKEEIKAWKAKYGEVHEIKVYRSKGKKEEKVFTAFLRNPYHELNVVSAALTMSDDPMKMNLYLLDNLMLKSDTEFQDDNQVRMTGGLQAKALVEILDVEAKKL